MGIRGVVWIGPRGLFKKLGSGRPKGLSERYTPVISIEWSVQRVPRCMMPITLIATY